MTRQSRHRGPRSHYMAISPVSRRLDDPITPTELRSANGSSGHIHVFKCSLQAATSSTFFLFTRRAALSTMASLVHLDLGRAQFESKTSDLRLLLSSSADFAPSAEDNVDLLQATLTKCTLNEDGRKWPWFSRGGNFRLVIALRLEDRLSACDPNPLLQHLSTQIQSAKVFCKWYRFGSKRANT